MPTMNVDIACRLQRRQMLGLSTPAQEVWYEMADIAHLLACRHEIIIMPDRVAIKVRYHERREDVTDFTEVRFEHVNDIFHAIHQGRLLLEARGLA